MHYIGLHIYYNLTPMSRLIPGIVIITAVAFGCGPKEDRVAQETNVQETNDYPDLVLALQEGGELSTKQLKGNNVFIFFQPDCRHCQLEAVEIEQRLDEFKNYKLYFISSGSMEAIKAFAESFDLDNKDNVRFARASTESVLKHYGPIQTPSIYIYAEGKLKNSFNGQTEIERILGAL